MPRTVLLDLTSLDTPSRARGIGRYLSNLARGLSRIGPSEQQGLRILALTRLSWAGDADVTEDLGSFQGSSSIPHPDQLDYYRCAYRRRLALWRAVRASGANLVHLGDPNATPLGWSATGCQRLLTCHDLIPLRFPGQYLGWVDGFALIGPRVVRRRFQSADHVVAISDATRDDVVNLLHVPREKTSRVYNGIPVDRWSSQAQPDDEARARRMGLQRGKFLLYVGDTDWRKNVEGMMAGLAHARSAGVGVRLALAGQLKPGKLRRLWNAAKQQGVHGAVKALGYVCDEDLGALYRTALAHLFVSRAEGFGLTVVEAMASGCPVITTNHGSLAEVAGNAALRVDPENPQEIGGAIVRLATDSVLREELRQLGMQQAPSFSVESQARGMVELYRRLLS